MARAGAPVSNPRRRFIPGILAAGVIGASGVAIHDRMTPEPEPEPVVALQVGVIDAGLLRDGFEGDGAGAPVPPEPPAYVCPDASPGWVRVQKSWGQLFSGGGWPQPPPYKSQSFPVPMPLLERNQYAMVRFVMTHTPQYVNFYWDQVQTRAPYYTKARPARGIFVTISPCPDDLRQPDYFSPDPFLKNGCRKFETTASLIFGTGNNFEPNSGCNLEQDKVYYLHLIAADPAGGIEPFESSCEAMTGGCDVGAITGGN